MIWIGVLTCGLMYASHKMIGNMKIILLSTDMNTTRRQKVIMTYEMAKKIRVIGFIGFILNVPFYLAFAISPFLSRNIYIVIPLNSIFLGLVIFRHSVNSVKFSRGIGQSSSTIRSGDANGLKVAEARLEEASGDMQQDSDFKSDSSPVRQLSSSPVSQFMRTLGKKPKKKPKKKANVMTRVTEEQTMDHTY
jgi:hypothetical protein